MPRTQKLWPEREGQGRTSTSLVIASMLTAMTMAYVLIVFHPRLVKAVDTAWSTWGGKPGWALSTVAAGAIVAAASLALFLLATVARGVQTAPYVWSAPVLVGCSALGLAQVSVTLPVSGLSAPAFAIASGLLMLVGGGLLQIRGWAFKVSGVLLLTLPVMTLAAGYGLGRAGLQGAWQELPNPGRLFVIVLGMTWLSMGLLSLATRPAAVARNAVQMALRWKERARASELKLAEVEQRFQLAEYRLRTGGMTPRSGAVTLGSPHQHASSQALSAFARPRGGGSQYLGAMLLMLVAILGGGYLSAYRPLQRKLEMQQALLLATRTAHQGSLDAIVHEFETERADLNRRLAAERAANAVQAATLLDSQDSSHRRQQNAQAPASAPPRSAPAAKKSAGPKRATWRATRSHVGAPAGGSGPIDDDPIGGLDDL